MKKHEKSSLRIVILFFLLTLCIFIPKQVAAKTLTKLNTSNCETINFSLELKHDALYITDIPDCYETQNLWFRLYSEAKNNQVWEEIFSSTELPIIIPLSDLKDDTYRIYLFTGANKYGNYAGHWFDEGAPKFMKRGTEYRFMLGQYYEEIKELHNNLLTNEYALEYYTQPSYWVESDAEEIRTKAKELTQDCTTDYDKVREIYEWIIQNIYYDYDALSGKYEPEVDSISVLKHKKSVCQGYADLTAALLRSLGIPTMVVSGNAASPIDKSNSNHAWNMVYVNNRWVFLDPTWDSTNKYKDGKYELGSINHNRLWFDTSLEMIAYSHYILDELKTMDDIIINAVARILSKCSIDTKSIDITYGTGDPQLVNKELAEYRLPKGYSYEYVITGDPFGTVDSKGNIKFKHGAYVHSWMDVTVYLKTPKTSVKILRQGYELLDNAAFVKSEKLKPLKLNKNATHPFDIRFLPTLEAFNTKYKVTYSSSDSKIAKVNKKGVITGKSKGNCTITAIMKVGTRKFTYKQQVTVR